MHPFHHRAAVVLLALLAVLTALVGCGDDDDDARATADGAEAGAGAEEPTGDEPGLSGEPIRIGMIAPVGTNGYNVEPEVAAAHAAVRGINEDGGIAGRPVELVFCNEGNEPNEAARCAQEMVDAGVIATAGNLSITAGPVVASTLADGGIPQIGTIAQSTQEFTNPTMFPLDAGSVGSFLALATDAVERGYERIGLVQLDVPATTLTADMFEQVVPELGAEYVGDVRVPTSATDLASAAQEMTDLDADMVVVQAVGKEDAMLQAATQLGAEYDFAFTDSAFTDDQIEDLGELLDGALLSGPTPPLSAADEYPAVAEVVEDLEAEHAAGNDDAAVEKARGNSMRVWLAVATVADVANASGATDAASLLQALDSGETFETRLGDAWDPTQTGPEGFDRVSRPLAYTFSLEDGEKRIERTEPYDVFAEL